MMHQGEMQGVKMMQASDKEMRKITPCYCEMQALEGPVT